MLDADVRAKRLPSGELLLRDVRVTAVPGEIVVLLGPSGVGKTSTLRIMLGLDEGFDGSVRCTATRIGALFQEPRLLPWRTIGDNIRVVIPRGHPMPDVAALLRDVGLPGSEGLYPGQISLGMARRAALVRALAIAPDLFILDEPFASLDPSTASLIEARFARIRRERGAAFVIAMHDIDRATTLATRIIVLSGRPATMVFQADIATDISDTDRAALRAELFAQFPLL